MAKDKIQYQNIYKQLGKNIRQARKACNISQEELAFRISSARNYIGCIERAEKAPSLAIIFDIARALNVDIQELFKDVS